MEDSAIRLQIPDASVAGPSQSSRSGGSSSGSGPGAGAGAVSAARPASAQVYPASAPHNAPSHYGSQSSRKRASHQVTTSHPEREEQVGYRDVYSHPAAVAYAAAHPKRAIPKFGPYLLLQTLGEGEFGKVKLGLHSQWGEEVAVKLIRRGNIDTAVRMSKVEREIEVLRTIKHPNIVRLYDVIETDKYIGIILEYASGGELFDHILAHRYLKEKDACKLFAQLVSGVWYIHQKKIVHRDLKLENLLLDRHRNVIITDFGFANRFEHRSDDLMQTSCGSPCYAAPELVISEGLYVGSAVDIWSCGVILYAMLAGYLPFDDDPANPDGDNINLLYRYIVNTPLTFPDYVSPEARDLLSLMLVPDPTHRADLKTIVAHRWLKPYVHLFDRSVQDLERLAMEQHQMKRLAYQRQMKQQAAAAASEQQKIQRSHSARMDIPPMPSSQRSRQPASSPANQESLYEANPDDSLFSSPTPVPVTRRHPASTVVGPSSSAYDDDPFGPPPTAAPVTDEAAMQGEEPRTRKSSAAATRTSRKQPPPVAVAPVKMSPERRKTDRQRHTIQLEYGGQPHEEIRPTQHGKSRQKVKESVYQAEQQADVEMELDGEEESPLLTVSDAIVLSPAAHPETAKLPTRAGSVSKATKPLPMPPAPFMNGSNTPKMSSADSRQESYLVASESQSPEPPVLSVTPTSPPRNLVSAHEIHSPTNGTSGSASVNTSGTGSSKSRHRKGISMDKFVGKLWGSGSEIEGAVFANGVKARRPSDASATPTGSMRSPPDSMASKRPSTLEVSTMPTPSASPSSKVSINSNKSSMKNSEGKKSRRNTLTVMVEPLSKRISHRSKNRSATADATSAPSPVNGRKKERPVVAPVVVPKTNGKMKEDVPATPRFAPVDAQGAIPASTSKASKVMQWFRYKSKSRAPSPVGDAAGEYEEQSDRAATPTAENQRGILSALLSEAAPHVVVQTPETPRPKVTQSSVIGRPIPSYVSDISVSATPHRVPFVPRAMNRLSHMVASPQPMRVGYNRNAIRLHHGAVDQTTVTTGSPPDVMAHVTKVLLDMGLEVQQESEYKYRCIRTKRKKVASGAAAGGLTAFTMVGSAASNGVDKRGLPMPSQSPFTSTGGMLKGLLMRRQSSQVSANPSLEGESDGNIRDTSNSSRASREKLPVMPAPPSHEPIYGDRTVDQGDEVRFSVELTRIDGLDDTFSIDIRRLKGHLRSYKFLYDTVRERCDLSR